jgi:hypothetical protein
MYIGSKSGYLVVGRELADVVWQRDIIPDRAAAALLWLLVWLASFDWLVVPNHVWSPDETLYWQALGRVVVGLTPAVARARALVLVSQITRRAELHIVAVREDLRDGGRRRRRRRRRGRGEPESLRPSMGQRRRRRVEKSRRRRARRGRGRRGGGGGRRGGRERVPASRGTSQHSRFSVLSNRHDKVVVVGEGHLRQLVDVVRADVAVPGRLMVEKTTANSALEACHCGG